MPSTVRSPLVHPFSCTPEIQAVVLAAGVGSRMREMTKKKPKCLLPIGNRPMIYYPLKYLQEANFTDVLVIVPDIHHQDIAEELKNFVDIRVEYLTIPLDQQLGTAESLALAKDRLVTDVIVLSCDIITNFPLIKLITLYRDQDPSLIALLSTRNPTATTSAYGSSKNRSEKDLVGVDGQRLVFFNSESDFGQSIPFYGSMTNQCTDFQIFTNYFDSHVYVLKKAVIDCMIREKVITSLKGELLPHLVEKQFRQQKDSVSPLRASESQQQPGEEQHQEDEMEDDDDDDVIESAFRRLEPSSGDRRGLLLRPIDEMKYPNGRTRCFVKVIREGFCVRSNSLAGYIEANKAIASLDPEKSIGKNFVNAILGKNSICAENSHIIRSVIGANSCIKANVKISDSVVLDGVTIEEGSVIQGSIICADARVGKKCSLERCLVSAGYQVHAQSSFANEFLADGGEDMFEF